jgi:hypothetical protein
VVHGGAHVIKKMFRLCMGVMSQKTAVTVLDLHAENTKARVFNRRIQSGG